jgi:hypothetical protein
MEPASFRTGAGFALLVTGLLAAACAAPGDDSPELPAPRAAAEFKAASTVDETLRRHRAVPTKTAWWDAVGEQLAWSHRNVHQIAPSVNVYRDGPVRPLARRPLQEIAEFPVETPDGTLGYRRFLDSEHSTTMGMVIVHRGNIVFEAYPRMQPYEKPIFWSVTKVLTSTVLAILEDRGEVDVSESVETYIPELVGTQLAGITLRNALDMASGIDCSDAYADAASCWNHMESTLGNGLAIETPEDNPYDMAINFDYGYWAEQGAGFDYASLNTVLIGWVIEKLTGMPFQDALTREVWMRIGAEADASIFAGRNGIPLVAGGLMANVRDVARFGTLFTPSHRVVSDRKIISDRYVDLILHGGRPELIENSRTPRSTKGVRHNVYQWDVFDNDDFYKGGWGGQGLLINPERDYAAAYAGYIKDAEGSEMDPLPVLRQVLEGVFGAVTSP